MKKGFILINLVTILTTGIVTGCAEEVPANEEKCRKFTWYADADHDAYGNDSVTVQACDRPPGYIFENSLDCDDNDPSVHPDADEIWYDGTDQDCDGRSDYDQDGDHHDAVSHGGDDCDDTEFKVLGPSYIELFDGLDNNCDGRVDESVSGWWYTDADFDGYGNEMLRARPGRYGDGLRFTVRRFTTQGGDCNDSDATINPGANELCDGIDDDCDGKVDEDFRE